MNKKQKAMLASYLRVVITAIAAVVATGEFDLDDLVKAAIISVLPPLMRWINPNDKSFGRGSE
jgi:hypothetical protein